MPLYIVGRGIYYAYFHSLAKIPGPKLYIFSELPYYYYLLKGDWHQQLKLLHDQYGPVVGYTYNDVSFTSATAFKTIYGHNAGGDRNFEKDVRVYSKERPQSNIVNAGNEDHRRMRRLISHAFSEKALANQEEVIKQYVDLFIGRLLVRAKSGEVVDLVAWYNFATFDLIGDLAFGQSFGCLDTEAYHPWVRMIFDTLKILVYKDIAKRLNLSSLIPYLVPAKLKKSTKEHYELSTQTAMKRLETKNMDREDFMSYFLRYNDERGMSAPELADNANILIIAGSETTATLLSGTTFLLLKNPEKYRKVAEEIRTSFQSEDEITISRVNQLSYMLATFSEGFRMCPPVPTPLPRAVPKEGDFVDGYFLPENYASDEKSVLQPFSLGPRNCIGKNLAYAEMRPLLARLLWNFDIKIMPDSLDWNKQKVYTLWEKGSLNVKLTKVERNSA
ncbi:unnamed protein product [Clonostachys rosea f. rosea IK726]|uniref:Uncharacterized protein n=1 Tax=Clonostachys rosea f. rosea IK726 TaxID=1349383 RepID=A0ACA9U1B4_BIOOC|nr:unnamed protein product [Clonostachys rosea f. rosea IK726]